MRLHRLFRTPVAVLSVLVAAAMHAATVRTVNHGANSVLPGERVQRCAIIVAQGPATGGEARFRNVDYRREAERLSQAFADALHTRHLEIAEYPSLEKALEASPRPDTAFTFEAINILSWGDEDDIQLRVKILRLPAKRKAGELILHAAWRENTVETLTEIAGTAVGMALDEQNQLRRNLVQPSEPPITMGAVCGTWSDGKFMTLTLNPDGTFADVLTTRDAKRKTTSDSKSTGQWTIRDGFLELSAIASDNPKRQKTERLYASWWPRSEWCLSLSAGKNTMTLVTLKRVADGAGRP